jgi:alanine-glyoxylate transaminase/serine-glyoxylate transaminase/serine-pyruvate transaminase
MAEMARRVGGVVDILDNEQNHGASAIGVQDHFKTHKYDVMTIVQGETSNTVWNRELQAIAAVAKAHGCLVVVDAVCTLSTMQLNMDEWHIDAVITGGQKGLSSIPGVSLLAFSQAAWDRIERRESEMPHWCLDARLADKFWNQNSYHYTAPVSGILAIHEALRLVCEETLSVRFRRHQLCSEALQAGIEAMGLTLLVDKPSRLNSVIGINVPDDVSADRTRACMPSQPVTLTHLPASRSL